VGGLGEGREGGEDVGVDFSVVGLACDGGDGAEAHFFCDECFEASDLVVVSFEECEVGGLCAGGAFDAAEGEGVEAVQDFVEVEDEVVAPEGGSFADGGELCGLEVGVAEGGQGAVFAGEFSEEVDESEESGADELEGLSHLDEVGVVADEGGGGAEVDDGSRVGSGVAEGVDVGHDVVAELFFVFGGFCEVDVFEVLVHLLELFGGDGQA